ncbi:hypothetical protein WME76_16720 [Sorangium sp. So ce119]|uniref:hypothetical protein n=1 Tax=Sorangium sp. So ce119 TaxID=3133279 RepID=UPI003F63FB6F
MKVHKLDVNVAEDRHIAFTLPEDFPPEDGRGDRPLVPPTKRMLAWVLGSLGRASPPPPEVDPIAELHRARNPG